MFIITIYYYCYNVTTFLYVLIKPGEYANHF